MWTEQELCDLALHLATPHSEGEQETGCHTHEANDLVLYHQNTPATIAFLDDVFTLTYKYLKSKRSGHADVLDKIENNNRLMFLGPIILNDVFHMLESRCGRFWKYLLENYKKEIGELEWELPEDKVRKDFQNWAFREFECWLPDHHLVMKGLE